MSDSTVFYPQVQATGDGAGLVSHAGAILLTRTAEVSALTAALSRGLGRWRKPLATHDPGKIVADLAVSLVAGGDCLADLATLRGRNEVFGPVASDPTVSRLIADLAKSPAAAIAAIAGARATARSRVWTLLGGHAPNAGIDAATPLIIDLDATLVTAHSDKESAAGNYKGGYGFHPLTAHIDHGPGGTGEVATMLLRPGNAGANTAADHITTLGHALAQIPGLPTRPGRKILIRADSAGGTHDFLDHLTKLRVSYSIGFGLDQRLGDLADALPAAAWTPAYDAERTPRENADVAELTGLMDLSGWPDGMRVIVRREKPHPGAQLRITDRNGWRLTAFATNTRRGQLADLELRHRRRARCEDRIRQAKDCGLQNLPFKTFAQNQIWLAVVALALDLNAWMQMLALTSTDARTWELKSLRLRLFATAARLARHARTRRLRFDNQSRHTSLLITGLTRLEGYRNTG
ncbi:IS1380 family transposase [Gordonia sp. PP30]|uniref:IS1380 family transposase n=1 Tax=Gordonia sp. PP30 TaxID=2935861 RepID=UPI001FFF448D|nr:IS1380 family transposase [Gordonia sp. PP30]UQE75250.1 IS1380 family transposase [Gordonia sp. PP30]UQE76167.1 IS1380 family transposase [Gordonia sp. PP30]UQE76172.1 IS1380 family transposase [Gordonia sp. PP30]